MQRIRHEMTRKTREKNRLERHKTKHRHNKMRPICDVIDLDLCAFLRLQNLCRICYRWTKKMQNQNRFKLIYGYLKPSTHLWLLYNFLIDYLNSNLILVLIRVDFFFISIQFNVWFVWKCENFKEIVKKKPSTRDRDMPKRTSKGIENLCTIHIIQQLESTHICRWISISIYISTEGEIHMSICLFW